MLKAINVIKRCAVIKWVHDRLRCRKNTVVRLQQEIRSLKGCDKITVIKMNRIDVKSKVRSTILCRP